MLTTGSTSSGGAAAASRTKRQRVDATLRLLSENRRLRPKKPQGLKTAYSVIEVEAIRQTDLLTGSSGAEMVVRGEAVTVDFPGGQTLFALLRTVNQLQDDLAVMSMIALDPDFNFKRADSTKRIAKGDRIRLPLEVPKDYSSLLVTFRNANEPASVALVDPDNLAASFGPGVRLRRIAVAATDQAVTAKLQSYLPWLTQITRNRGTLIPDPPRLLKDSSIIHRVSTSDFSTQL